MSGCPDVANEREPYRWVVLGAATTVQISVSMVQQAPAALGPAFLGQLGIGHTQLGLLSSALIGGMTVTTLAMGILIDRVGERWVVALSVACMALFIFLAGLSSGFWWLLLLFLLASFGAAASTPGGSKAATAWFPFSQRGLALGIRQTGIPTGGLAAALVLPVVVAAFGWRAGLFCAAGVALAATVAFVALYRESPATPVHRDEPRVDSFSTLKTLFSDRSFVAATIFSFVLVGGQWSATAFIAVFAHERVGISVVNAGVFLALAQAGGIAGRVLFGIVSDRLGSRKPLMLVAGVGATFSCLAVELTSDGAPLMALGIACFALGFSLLGWNGIYIAYLSEAVSRRSAATALGAGLTVTNLGSLAVPPLFGLLVDMSDSYTVLWLSLAAWAAMGTACATLIKDPAKTTDK